MADETLPQTKEVQKLQAYQGGIPSYLAAVDRAATMIGLRIARRVAVYSDRREAIYSFYSGTSEQFLSFPLIKAPLHFPRNEKRPSKVRTQTIGPGVWGVSLYRTGENTYSLRVRLDAPTLSAGDDAIERHEFDIGQRLHRKVYIGTAEALMESCIAVRENFPADGEDPDEKTEWGTLSGASYILRQTIRMFDGRWAYIEYPAEIQKFAERQSEATQSEALPTVEQWLHQKEYYIRAWVEVQLKEGASSTFPKHGVKYVADRREMQEIADAIELIAQRIRDVRVSVEKLAPNKTPRSEVTSIARDEKFQQFIRKALGFSQGRANGGEAE